ncbi:MAG: LacI family DNA-binding transcriptional regulator [Telluria sp.]
MPIIPALERDKNTTLDDVARLAGVSRITASRVVNNKGGSRGTRERVLQAVAELGYQPNSNARDLRYRKVVRLGLLFLREGSPNVGQLLTGLLEQPVDANLQVAVAPCRTVREACEEARRLVLNGIDGFMLPAPLGEHAELVRQIERAGCAIVSLSGAGTHTSRSVVGVNESDAAFAMTAHLIGLGHRRIGFIAGDPAHRASLQRLAGYQGALEAHGIAGDEALVAGSASTYRSGLDAAERLINGKSRPTAIFASNDETAAAAMAVAYQAGIEIPGDLTVAGFGDTPLATAIWPALTTVRVPVERMVGHAIHILARQVGRIRANAPPDQEQAILDFEVIRRQTDAVPRERPPAPFPGWHEQATLEKAYSNRSSRPQQARRDGTRNSRSTNGDNA